MKRMTALLLLILVLLTACETPQQADAQPALLSAQTVSPEGALPNFALLPTITATVTPTRPTRTPLPGETQTPTPEPTVPTLTPTITLTPTELPPVPVFDHIVVMVFENQEYTSVIGNRWWPVYNRLGVQFTLLTKYFAVTHPSLPNYLAMIGGDTFKVDTNYPQNLIDAPILTDYIESSGRTWKAYMDSMPEACGLEDNDMYVQQHNPFVYFSSIRTNTERCKTHIVPMTELDSDLKEGKLPNFVFVAPNLCHSARAAYTNPEKCGLQATDAWIGRWVDKLMAYPSMLTNGVVIITWDEGESDHGCCGMRNGGGRVPTLLISSRVKQGFQDDTPYTHYSLIKTIADSWTLPAVGRAADDETNSIRAPWFR
jgi:phosphatidylinositol-3-phosphatase